MHLIRYTELIFLGFESEIMCYIYVINMHELTDVTYT